VKIVNGDKRGRPGRWLLDFYDQEGKRRRETYETQKEAKAALADRAKEVKESTYRAPAELPTLEEVAGAWLVAKGLEGLRPSTIAGLENHVHDHVLPALGSSRIDLVSLKCVEALKAKLATEKKLAARTVNKTLAALKAIFDYAISNSYMTRNPAASVKPMKLGKSDSVTAENVPSAEDVAKLIEAASAGLHRTFLLASAHTGAREGELLALAWDDVDLDGRTLTIRRSDSWAKTRAERAEKTVKGARPYEPKTEAGRRVVRIDDDLVRELRRWRLACPRGKRGLVFPNAAGDPLHRKTLQERGFLPARAAAGLRAFTVHSLRHFHASALLLAGVPIAEVSARLGHGNAAITMKVYTHFIRGAESKAAETIAGLIRSARNGGRAA
jgi:integrase